MYRHKIYLSVVVAFTLATHFAIGAEPHEGVKSNQQSKFDPLIEEFADALTEVQRNYYKSVDRRELVQAAIAGMMSKLDEHSQYIAAKELEDRDENGVSRHGGIGVHLMIDSRRPTVVSPIVGGPAHRAKLMSGDVITHIDGDPTEGYSLSDAIGKLKGKLNTDVELTLLKVDGDTSVNVRLTREDVKVDTVRGFQRRSDGSWNFWCNAEEKLAYIRITSFSATTVRELRAALNKLTEDKIRGLILDLRANPGGLLTSAVEVSDMFVASGTIVTTDGRAVEPRRWSAHQAGTFSNFPMAVLINRFSASGSEIVAACLQDHNRAAIVGQRTWGKGTVQNILGVQGGRALIKLTTAEYFRPNGNKIDRDVNATSVETWGVTPDEGLVLALSDKDSARLERQREQQELSVTAATSKQHLRDAQFEMALEHLRATVSR